MPNAPIGDTARPLVFDDDGLLETQLARIAMQRMGFVYVVDDIASGNIYISPNGRAPMGLPDDDSPLTYEWFVENIMPAHVRQVSREMRQKAIDTATPYESYIPIKNRLTGDLETYRLDYLPQRDESGKVYRLIGVAHNVTQQQSTERALQREREMLARVQKLSRTGYFFTDVAAGKVTFSESLCDLLGMPYDETPVPILDKMRQMFQGDVLEAAIQRIRTAILTGKSYQASIVTPHLETGEDIHLVVTGVPETDRYGTVLSLFGIFQDITEDQRIRRELEEQNARFAQAVDMAELGHFKHDYVNKRSFWSDKTFEFFGVEKPEGEWFGVDLFEDRFQPGELERYHRLHDETVAAGRKQLAMNHHMIRGSDDDKRVIYSERTFEYDDEGNVVSVFGVSQDVTHIRRLERDRELREALFRRAENVLQFGYYLNDWHERKVVWSDQLYAMAGMRERYEHLRGMDRLAMVMDPDGLAQLRDLLGKAIKAREQSVSHRLMITRRTDGEQRTVHNDAEIEYAPDGTVMSIFGVAHDITDRLRQEAERETLEVAVQKAQRADALNYFAGGLAHELFNMLQPAVSYSALAESALHKGDVEGAQRSLQSMQQAIDRATDLTREALSYSRHEDTGPSNPPLSDVVEAAQSMIDAIVRARLRWHLPSGLEGWRSQATTVQMTQVLLNLLNNAIDAAGEGVRVEITLTITGAPEQPQAQILVSDNGPGMSDEALSSAFTPYFTTKGGQGTGLGLAVCRGIVERWGGKMTARSTPGEGVEIDIQFPLEAIAAPALSAPEQAVAQS